MGGRDRPWDWIPIPDWIPMLLLLLFPGTAALEVSVPPKIRGFIGEDTELSCDFRSSLPITQRLTVDWSYRASEGGSKHAILHYQSKVFLALSGPFKDRVVWNGELGKGNASIILKNLTQSDNGTFSCVVQNPPDVSSEIPSTALTVTERELPFRISVVVMLMLLVVVPSLLVVAVLLLWMGRTFGYFSSSLKNTSIEVVDGVDEGCPRNRIYQRCAACYQYSDEEDDYFHRFYPPSEPIASSEAVVILEPLSKMLPMK
ncbi:myelin protein zero-like protein 3 [Mustelus asterias]